MANGAPVRPHVRRVLAHWDPEARVWVAESDDVPGLITEADTVEQLLQRLQVLVPELLELNEEADGDVPVELVTSVPQQERRAA